MLVTGLRLCIWAAISSYSREHRIPKGVPVFFQFAIYKHGTPPE